MTERKPLPNRAQFPVFIKNAYPNEPEGHYFNMRYDGPEKLSLLFRDNTRDVMSKEFIIEAPYSDVETIPEARNNICTGEEMFEYLCARDDNKDQLMEAFNQGWNALIDGVPFNKCPHEKVDASEIEDVHLQWQKQSPEYNGWTAGWKLADAYLG